MSKGPLCLFLRAILVLLVPGTAYAQAADECANAIDFGPGDAVVPIDSTRCSDTGLPATTGSEIQCPGLTTDVWVRWTAEGSGSVTIDTCAGATFDTALAVWRGADCDSLLPLGCSDDSALCGASGRIRLDIDAGDVLYVQLGSPASSGGAAGRATLTIDESPGPANDECTDPAHLDGLGSFAFSTVGASTSGFAGGGTCSPGAAAVNQDVFFAWTAPAPGDYSFDTFGSGFDTRLSVHTGADCSAVCVGHDDDTLGLQSRLVLRNVGAGDAFLVQVGGFGAGSGAALLTIEAFVDACENAADDGFEPNDACTTPAVIAEGFYVGLLASLASPDFYSIELQPDEVLEVTVTDTAQEDLDLRIYDAACELLLTSSAETATVSTVGASGPTRFVVEVFVNPRFAGQGCLEYTMRLDVEPDACVLLGDDPLEPNDTCATATPQGDGDLSGLVIQGRDDDFFRVGLAPGATLEVEIYFQTGDADLDLYLWDPAGPCGTKVAGEGFSAGALALGFTASNDELVRFTNTSPVARELLVEVTRFDFSQGRCAAYDLRVTGSNGALGVGVPYCDANANSTGGTASILALGSRVAFENDLEVATTGLPANAVAVYLVSSTQFFLPNPGGSAGNLCIAGEIGRYVGAGEIQDSGPAGAVSLTLDLGGIPLANGAVPVVPGDRFNWTTWFRDAGSGGSATSNFSNAVEVVFF
ncbi:MAG: hypothetical protein AAGB93_04125 [Planctomycetota bacterium]